MWLRDFLPSALGEQVRILTFGYDTGLRDKTATPMIQNFARSLLEHLCSARTESDVRVPENSFRKPRLTDVCRNAAVP